MEKITAEEIYRRYERGVDYLEKNQVYSRVKN